MEIYHVLRIDEQLYGCEELPEGQPVCCDVLLEDAAGQRSSPTRTPHSPALPSTKATPSGSNTTP